MATKKQRKVEFITSRIVNAVAQVAKTGSMSQPPREGESRRMKHTRIANDMAELLIGEGFNAVAWPVYEGEGRFSFVVRVGDLVMFAKPESAEDPV
jgi:hypothetical protein